MQLRSLLSLYSGGLYQGGLCPLPIPILLHYHGGSGSYYYAALGHKKRGHPTRASTTYLYFSPYRSTRHKKEGIVGRRYRKRLGLSITHWAMSVRQTIPANAGCYIMNGFDSHIIILLVHSIPKMMKTDDAGSRGSIKGGRKKKNSLNSDRLFLFIQTGSKHMVLLGFFIKKWGAKRSGQGSTILYEWEMWQSSAILLDSARICHTRYHN